MTDSINSIWSHAPGNIQGGIMPTAKIMREVYCLSAQTNLITQVGII